MSKGRSIQKIIMILIGIILLLSASLNTFLILRYNVLPAKYLVLYFIIVCLVPIIFVYLTSFTRIRYSLKYFLTFIEIIYIIILFMVFTYLNQTFNFLDDITHNLGYEIKNYYVLVKNDSNLQNINDIHSKKLGHVKDLDESIDKALNKIKSKVENINLISYEGYSDLIEALNNNQIDSLLITSNYYNMLNDGEENPISSFTNIIYKFSITENIKDIAKDVDVTKNVFNIYVSGMDSDSSIESKYRSDVNIILNVNPKTNKIIMLNIPRDYYVDLYYDNENHGKDKLTHTGMYGIDASVETLEKLLDIDINYYVKVNYNALTKMVDNLDGVDVYSEYNFSGDYYHFKKGYNHVNGKQALEFVRVRKAFLEGDRVRGQNQQAMIEAIIKKVSSTKTILLKYDKILESLKGSFITNISTNKIFSIVRLQLDKKMPKWEIKSISLNGSDAHELTYSYPHQELYVMVPKEETIKEAKEEILKN